MLELSDQKFKTIIITMLKSLMGRSRQKEKYMGNVRERKNKLEMLQSKSTVTEINSAFDEIISKIEYNKGKNPLSLRISKLSKQKSRKKKTEILIEYTRTMG